MDYNKIEDVVTQLICSASKDNYSSTRSDM